MKKVYYNHNSLDKTSHDLKLATDIKKLPGWNPDFSVEHQAYLVQHAEAVIGSETGALHLGVFAPAKKVIGFFEKPENFFFPWVTSLIDLKNGPRIDQIHQKT